MRVAAPGHHIEHGRGEIDAANLRLAMRTKNVARVPESRSASRRRASGASGALLGRIEGDAFGDEMIDAAFRIEAKDLLQSAVDHIGDSFDCERRLRHIR